MISHKDDTFLLSQIVDIEPIEETGSLVMTCAGDTAEGAGLKDWIFQSSSTISSVKVAAVSPTVRSRS